jgi:hypothetical protein
MATLAFENQNTLVTRDRLDWSAVWAGMFTFIGIWSVFGLLGAAIFASSANPSAARPITGMGWGESIWAIVLTIIAMWFGGMVTGRLASARDRNDGVVHGMTMFGLSMAAVVIIVLLGGMGVTGNAESAVHSSYFLNVISGLGWAGFLSVFLGWLAAMGGASVGSRPRVVVAEKNVTPMRNAA